MEDKELYNKYQDTIPDYETFKSIKDKKLKSLLFTGWIAKFGSKEIRRQMNIPYSTYDYNVRKYTGGADAIEEEEDETTETKRGGRPKGAKNKSKEAIDVSGYTVPDRHIVEGEFEEIDNDNALSLLSAAKLQDAVETPTEVNKPFISVEWTNTPESISAQLEALATVLKFESGTIKVKLEVFNG